MHIWSWSTAGFNWLEVTTLEFFHKSHCDYLATQTIIDDLVPKQRNLT